MDERRIALFGMSGSGKTTALQMLAECPPADRAGLILDLKGDQLSDGGLYPTTRSWLRRPHAAELPDADGPWFEWVNGWARQVYQDGSTFLMVDEVAQCVRRGQPPPELVRILVMGRSRKIGWALATQRPVSVPPSVWAQANELFIFALRHPRDLELARDLGLTRAQADALPGLPWGHFFHVVGRSVHLHRGLTQSCAAAEDAHEGRRD